MSVRKLIRLCAVLVLSGFSSVAVSQTLTFSEAIHLIDEEGHAEIPSHYTEIGAYAFRNLADLKSISIPSTVISIGDEAFFGTSNLSQALLSSGIEIIGNSAFEGSGIKKITLPPTLTRIGNRAFYFGLLTELSIPESLDYVGDYAFAGNPLRYLEMSMLDTRKIKYGTFIEACRELDTLVINSHEAGRLYPQSSNHNNTSDLPELVSLGYGSSQTFYNQFNFNTMNCDIKNVFLRGVDEKNIGSLIIRNLENLIVETNVLSIGEASFENAKNIFIVDGKQFPTENLGKHVNLQFCSSTDSDGDSFIDCIDDYPLDSTKWIVEESNDSNFEFDTDGDGILDIYDISSFEQYCTSDMSFGADAIDTDQDGVSNYNDCDDDNDGLLDVYETGFPFNYDISVDGLLSGLQLGTNPLNPDSDFDGTLDGLDAFPLDNTESLDTDTDGIGNNADTDDDNDGHFDLLDAFPLDANEWMDSDSDGIGNNADTDDDNDSVLDEEDAFPYTALESVDTDGDGVGDNSDAFPNDSSETLDTDLDGIGNNADGDDDNDGVVDTEDSDPLNDSIGALESQNLFVMGNPVAVNGYLTTISVGYDVSDANNQLTGIGFRVHYDSSIYSYSVVENTLNDSVVVDGMGPYQDVEDFDNDSTTDSYLVYGWASVSGEWPSVELPAKLSDIKMFVNWADYDAGSTTSNINFSIVDNAEGYEGKATNYAMTVLPATWDFDGNGMADALTDGLMLLRYTFNITDLNMTAGAIADNATLSPTQVVENMQRALPVADIDGNGSTDALTDGLLLLRYMFNLRGENLVSGAISSDATRTTAEEIEGYIELYMPNELTLPVQSEQNFMVGDWKLASAPEANYTDEIINGTAEWNQTSGTGDHKFSCMADDVYKFDQNGTFSYIHGEGTYAREGITSFYTDAGCSVIRSPWDGSFDMHFVVNEDESTVKVVGKGAYIGLPHVANGINEIPEPYFAPDEVIYNYTKISDDEIQLDVLGGYFGYRFRLQRVLGN
ncbi:leucine-rich repeat domain-containing protein [Porticoccaceae bacterium]|nr:leucine-rich repeat domain-containing protein [Porticoccaceae bacterium]